MIIVEKIEKYLARDETIEKEFDLRGRLGSGGCRVYASNKRLFIIRGNSIKDIDYSHIASIELKEDENLPAVVVGSMCVVAGVVVLLLRLLGLLGLTYWWGLGLVVLGLVLLSLGLLMRIQSVRLVVVGLPGGETLSGHRSELDALFRIVRENLEG